MKLITPNIVYHDIEPVYTCDIQSKSDDFIRLATGGFDCAVRLWKLNFNFSSANDFRPVDLISTLARHEKRVNVVRWSPSGNILASASDDGVIILWSKSSENNPAKMDNDDEVNLENWTPRCLRRHFQDVYDLCWSMNENHLISGSIDCCAILWNLKNISKVIILKDHKQFVQGVAWDPLDNFVITQSSDRTMRVYRASSRTCIYKVWKSGDSKLFQDGSFKYFFRRLEFSPDGKLLITPAGYYERKKADDDTGADLYTNVSNDTHAAHIFVRHNLSKVAVTIPTGKNAVTGVRFNPVRYCLRNKGGSESGVFKLPYRWVFCLVLDSGLLIYDTEQCLPVARIFDIHCCSINDASWSADGRILIASSTDGYLSYIYFDEGELGEPYTILSKQIPCVANTKNTLVNIENVIEMKDEPKINFINPILELDPTEILRASVSRNDHLSSDDSSTDDMIMESNQVSKKRTGNSQVTPTSKFEPEPKKRRLTLTTLN